jgi:predicted ATPase
VSCSSAGLHGQAIGYWQKAGQRAIEHSANLEAIGHLTTALDVLKALPDTPKRIQHELTLYTALGVPQDLTLPMCKKPRRY